MYISDQPLKSYPAVSPSAKPSNNPTHDHLRHRRAGRLDNSTDSNDRRAKNDLSRTAQPVASEERAHGAEEAADVVQTRHGALHVGRGIAKGVEEVLVDDLEVVDS